MTSFLDFLTSINPSGGVYLFGGVLRDLALLGRKGFNSDIDLVIEGDWCGCSSYIESLSARKNKFGGYRLNVAGWDVDIWNAEETWAIKKGLVSYEGVASLTDTTVLNWDAILMNWGSKKFICREGYLDFISSRCMDLVLEENPNPVGMVVRIFRHLSMKDARKITPRAIDFLAESVTKYSYSDLVEKELSSYGNILIDRVMYEFFREVSCSDSGLKYKDKFESAVDSLKRDGVSVSFRQQTLFSDEF